MCYYLNVQFQGQRVKDAASRTLTFGPPYFVSLWEANSCPVSQPATSLQCTPAHIGASVWSLSTARRIHTNFLKTTHQLHILTIIFHLRLNLPRELFSFKFSNKNVCLACLSDVCYMPRPSNVPGLIIILAQGYELWNFSCHVWGRIASCGCRARCFLICTHCFRCRR